jgi:hypothetical protein
MTNAATTTNIRTDALGILHLIGEFGGLLLNETAALKKSDFTTVESLQMDKKRFAREYHMLVTGLAERRAETSSLDIETRERLIRARTEFTIILNDNMKALDAAKNSTKRLVNRILETARRATVNNRQTNYSSRGKAVAYKTATLSLSVDQKL